MKELNILQMEEMNGGGLISDQAAICATIAVFGIFFAASGIAAVMYVAAGAVAGCFG